MCIVFSTIQYKVNWGVTQVGRQLDMKGMLWVLQYGIPSFFPSNFPTFDHVGEGPWSGGADTAS